MSKDIFMSVSRMKKFDVCSLQYAASYLTPIPQHSNNGAKTGLICHGVCEHLLPLKRKKYTKKILKNKNVYCIKSLKRYVLIRCKKEKLEISAAILDNINKYCLVALEQDFYCEGGKLESAEKEFRIESQSPYYKVMGYIDKVGKFGEKKIKITDFKSQKQKFEGEDLTINSQGLMYALSELKENPGADIEVEFIFLQFPNDPIFIFKPTKRMLTGFEYYLEYQYKRISEFTDKDKYNNLAYDKGYVAKEEGFKGRLLCGKTRGPNESKKDGSPAWECFCKWPMNYYVTIKDGRETPYFTKEEIKLKEGEKIEERRWLGCPRFNKNIGQIAANDVEWND